MDKIFAITLNDLRITFKDRSIWIYLLVMPTVLVIAVAFANGAFASVSAAPDKPTLLLDVVDLDNSELSAQFLGTLRTLDTSIKVCPMDNTAEDICQTNNSVITSLAQDAEAIDARLLAGTVVGYLEIPSGFAAAFTSGQPIDLVFRANANDAETISVRQTLQTAIQRISGVSVAGQLGAAIGAENFSDDPNFVPHVTERAAEMWLTNPVSIAYSEAPADERTVDPREAPGFRQSAPGMGSMYVMFMVLAGTSVLILERKQYTFQRILTTPVTGGQVIIGKMLARFVLGMIQFMVVFSVGIVFGTFMNFNFGNNPIGLVLVMAAFVLAVCALTLLLATMVKTDQQASNIATFTALILAPIGGAWWSLDLEFIPDFMRQIAWISPVRWAMQGFNVLIFDNASILDILPYVGGLLALTVVLFTIAARRFKYE